MEYVDTPFYRLSNLVITNSVCYDLKKKKQVMQMIATKPCLYTCCFELLTSALYIRKI